MYNDPNISEKERSEVCEAATRIMKEAAEKKAARARWMIEREEKKKSLQVNLEYSWLTLSSIPKEVFFFIIGANRHSYQKTPYSAFQRHHKGS